MCIRDSGKVWRIGLMGYSCRPDNVMLCLSALGSVLSDMGLPIHVGDAEAAAHGAYAQMVRAPARAARHRRPSAAGSGPRARPPPLSRRQRSDGASSLSLPHTVT